MIIGWLPVLLLDNYDVNNLSHFDHDNYWGRLPDYYRTWLTKGFTFMAEHHADHAELMEMM